jgi:putative tryptophan/tyrosine transport system substrate-binding protein
MPRIGVIWLGTAPSPPASPRSSFVRFRESLGELGYVEGLSIEIESRFAGAGIGLDQVVENLISLRVAVIVAVGTPVALAAKNSSNRSIPVVFSILGDPIRWGLVKSLAHPGGNLTGVYSRTIEHTAKRLSLLHEAVPRSAHIAILAGGSDELREAQTAAKQLNVQLFLPLQIGTADDIEPAFRAAKRAGVTAMSVHLSPQILTNLRRVADLSRTYQFRAIAPFPNFAQLGGLMEYHASNTEELRRVAAYVDKILKGAKPADLPVEQPTKFELVINLKTAKALGLTIPQTLLVQANQVIE